MNLSLGPIPERVMVGEASASFFQLLGVAPALGRAFSTDDEDRRGNHLAVLSFRLWQDRLHATPDIVGTQIILNGAAYTVIGVMPSRFRFPGRTDVWIPRDSRRTFQSERLGSDSAVGAGVFGGSVIGRLRADTSPETAASQLRALQAASLPPALRGRFYVDVSALREGLVGSRRGAVRAVVAAALGLFVGVCVTLLNLVLLHENARQDETCIRYSLGATRLNLVRSRLLEWARLASLSCGLALLLTTWTIPLLRAVGPEYFPPVEALSTNLATLLSSLALALIAATVGIAGSLSLLRRSSDINWSSYARLASESSRRQSGVRRKIALAQVVLMIPLLSVAVLEVRALEHLTSVDPGFELANRYAVRVHLPAPRYDPTSAHAFFERAVAELSSVPGVLAVGYAESIPFDGQTVGRVWYQPYGIMLDGHDSFAYLHEVSRGYLRALGADALQGASFPDYCTRTACDVALVDERTAERLWGGNAIGRTVTIGDLGVRRIGGVVRLVRFDLTANDATPHIFVLGRQQSRTSSVIFTVAPGWNQKAWVVKALLSLDGGAAVGPIRSLDTLFADAVGPQRRRAYASVVFVGVTVMIALGSLWLVMAFACAQMRGELAIRSAFGAPPVALFAHVVRPALMSQAVAVAVGAGASMMLGRGFGHLLGGLPGGTAGTVIECTVCVWFMAGCVTGIVAWGELRANVLAWERRLGE